MLPHCTPAVIAATAGSVWPNAFPQNLGKTTHPRAPGTTVSCDGVNCRPLATRLREGAYGGQDDFFNGRYLMTVINQNAFRRVFGASGGLPQPGRVPSDTLPVSSAEASPSGSHATAQAAAIAERTGAPAGPRFKSLSVSFSAIVSPLRDRSRGCLRQRAGSPSLSCSSPGQRHPP